MWVESGVLYPAGFAKMPIILCYWPALVWTNRKHLHVETADPTVSSSTKDLLEYRYKRLSLSLCIASVLPFLKNNNKYVLLLSISYSNFLFASLYTIWPLKMVEKGRTYFVEIYVTWAYNVGCCLNSRGNIHCVKVENSCPKCAALSQPLVWVLMSVLNEVCKW